MNDMCKCCDCGEVFEEEREDGYLFCPSCGSDEIDAILADGDLVCNACGTEGSINTAESVCVACGARDNFSYLQCDKCGHIGGEDSFNPRCESCGFPGEPNRVEA